MFDMDEKKPPVELYKKIAEIYETIQYIPKRGKNDYHGYTYPLEADVNDKCRTEMAKRKVVMIPTVVSRSMREITTAKGNTEYIATVEMHFRFIDAETGQEEGIDMPGEGQDRGDKAIYKAISGAQKYALLKMFMIATGDDPEATTDAEREEKEDNKGRGRGQRQQQTQQRTEPQNSASSTKTDGQQTEKQDQKGGQSDKEREKQRWIDKANELYAYAESLRLTREELRRHGDFITGKADVKKWTVKDMDKIHESLVQQKMPEPEPQEQHNTLPAEKDLPWNNNN